MDKLVLGLLVLCLFIGVAGGCSAVQGGMVNQQVAVDAMQGAGFTDIQIVDKHTVFVDLQGCSAEDVVKFDVAATNSRGERVSNAYVCAGWPFKGATIRYR